MPMISYPAGTAETGPQHQETLQEWNEEERLQSWYPALKIPNEEERGVHCYAGVTCEDKSKFRE